MKAVLRWIVRNSPLMVLASVLSLLTWFVALETEDPTRTGRFPQPIPIKTVGLPDGMILLDRSSESVRVEIRTTESVWQSLSPEDFTASVDLAGLGPGVHEVPVHVALSKMPSQVMSLDPESITVELERGLKRSVPVRVQIEGKPALGYLRRAATVTPREVVISGPETYVTQVVEAVTVISVQDASADVEGEFPLEPQGSGGEPVPYTASTPATVKVRIPIELSGYYRPLAVKAVLEGQVAADYRITNISVDPPTITVFGPPDVIAAIPGFVETEPISVEGALADVIERPELRLPENVSIVTGQKPVEVRVSVKAIQSSRTVEITPTLQGLGVGLTATVPLEAVEVILSGPLPQLESLEADDVRVVLDLFGLPVGKHQIQPQVIVPEGIKAQNILPSTMQVEISVMAPPTPTLPLTSTTTLTE